MDNYDEEKKKYFTGELMVVLFVGLLFTSIGIIIAILNDDFGARAGGIFFAVISSVFIFLPLYASIGQMIYDKHPWKTEKIFWVKKVIPISEKYREELYEMYSIDADESDDMEAQRLEELIKTENVELKYAVFFSMYSKYKSEKFNIEDFDKMKAVTQSYIYETPSNRFKENQLYVCDTTKYEVTFLIENFKEEDFEYLGTIE